MGDPTTSLGDFVQCLTTLIVIFVFLIRVSYVPAFTSCFSLSPYICEKALALLFPTRQLQTAVRSPLTLLFHRMNQPRTLQLLLSVPGSSPERCRDPALDSLLYARVCPAPGAQTWTLHSWCGLAGAQQQGRGSAWVWVCFSIAPQECCCLQATCYPQGPREFLQSCCMHQL